ncbi:MAG: HTTM domain-containing protein [Acidimicrobiales bacterium]
MTPSPWDRFLFEPQSTSAMTLVRVGWGAVMAVWALSLLPDVDPLLTGGALGYGLPLPGGSWNPVEWTSWSAAPMAVCLLLLVTAVATMVGFRTRLSSVVAVLCLIALQRTNSTVFNSGDLTLRLIGISVALAPCGLLWSLDARRNRRRGVRVARWRAPWAQRLLQLHIAVGYLLSAWGKVRGSTWQDGTALGMALRIEDLQRFVAPPWLFDQQILLNLLTWGTVAFEAGFAILVWNRRLRPWVLGIGVAFHLGIDLFLDIGFFSLAMWIAYLAFLDPDQADRIVARFDPGGVAEGVEGVADLPEHGLKRPPSDDGCPGEAARGAGVSPTDGPESSSSAP